MPSLFRSLPAKVLLAVVLTAVLVGIGVARTGSREQRPADPLATPLSAVDTTTLTVRRATFCGRLAAEAVSAALGAPPRSHESWRPGQSRPLNAHVTDVVDEYGCSWTSASGAAAQAWVFAPPVTFAAANRLAHRKPAGCTPLTPAPAAADEPGFGRPTSALTCGDSTLLRGLFGDAWLSCSLPSHDLDRVGRWCLAVARAAG